MGYYRYCLEANDPPLSRWMVCKTSRCLCSMCIPTEMFVFAVPDFYFLFTILHWHSGLWDLHCPMDGTASIALTDLLRHSETTEQMRVAAHPKNLLNERKQFGVVTTIRPTNAGRLRLNDCAANAFIVLRESARDLPV